MNTVNDNLEQFLQVHNVTKNSADLYFYGYIVSSWWGALDECDQYPASVKNFLNSVKGKNLNIYINSGGGNVFAGIAIYNMLKRHEGYKVAYNDGVMASISSVIPLAADKVIMPENSLYMVHKPMLNISGNADTMRTAADILDKTQECILQTYMQYAKPGITKDMIDDLMNAESWLNAQDTQQYFNFEISAANKVVASAQYSGFSKNIENSFVDNALNIRKTELIEAQNAKNKKILQTKLNFIRMKGVNRCL